MKDMLDDVAKSIERHGLLSLCDDSRVIKDAIEH
jgi:hypothetical protein